MCVAHPPHIFNVKKMRQQISLNYYSEGRVDGGTNKDEQIHAHYSTLRANWKMKMEMECRLLFCLFGNVANFRVHTKAVILSTQLCFCYLPFNFAEALRKLFTFTKTMRILPSNTYQSLVEWTWWIQNSG